MTYQAQKTQVLIVEDDPIQANTVQIALQRDQRVTTLIVHSAEDAFAEIQKARTGEKISLVVLDIDLEAEGIGYSVLAAAARPPRIPVIVLTGRPTVDLDSKAALQGGALTYMEKPFSADELLSTAQNVIEISGGFVDIIKFPNEITFSPITRALEGGPLKKPVLLGEVQGHVFQIIAAGGETGADSTEILREVWNSTSEPTRLVGNNVTHLRGIFESNNVPLTIETLTKGRKIGRYRVRVVE